MERGGFPPVNANPNGGAEFYHSGSLRSSSPTRLAPLPSTPSASAILHTVSKYDTLAGVAIKYGVEVADIKKLNGLVTDLQMFALKTIKIPLPGRHPPSAFVSNGHRTPPRLEENSASSFNFPIWAISGGIDCSNLEIILSDMSCTIKSSLLMFVFCLFFCIPSRTMTCWNCSQVIYENKACILTP